MQAAIAEQRIAGGVGALSRSWLGSINATCGDGTRVREKLAELHAFEAKRYVDPATTLGQLAAAGILLREIEMQWPCMQAWRIAILPQAFQGHAEPLGSPQIRPAATRHRQHL